MTSSARPTVPMRAQRRKLTRRQRIEIFDHAGQRCHLCEQVIQPGQKWELDHVKALAFGGPDDAEYMAPAHVACHQDKTAAEHTRRAKADRQRAAHLGIPKRKGRPMPGTKASGVKKRFDGTVVRRA